MAAKRIFSGLAYGFTGAFQNDQQAGPEPAVFRHERQKGNGDHVDAVPQHGHPPIVFCLVGDDSGREPERIADAFAEAGGKAERGGRSAEQGKICPVNAACPFVGHVREQTDNAHEHDKDNRRRRIPQT